VHHQNDSDTYDPPKEYAHRYPNPFIPQDLRALPGSWPSQLSDYCACVARIDDAVATIRQTLAETGLDRNTILVFMSDHGCHFKTRNTEYKRSPHESSIHIPLIVEGPGFNRSLEIPELVSQVDLAPALLEAGGRGGAGIDAGTQFPPSAGPAHRRLAQRGVLRDVGIRYWQRSADAAVYLRHRRAQGA
jgi:arylsulfatase A-like enzyme